MRRESIVLSIFIDVCSISAWIYFKLMMIVKIFLIIYIPRFSTFVFHGLLYRREKIINEEEKKYIYIYTVYVYIFFKRHRETKAFFCVLGQSNLS